MSASSAGHSGREESLSGKLLVALPDMVGGVFERSVVYLLHHGEDGAQGVVLNKPVDAAIDDILPGWQDYASAPARVYQGGPVGLDTAIGLVIIPGDHHERLGLQRLNGAVGLVDLDAPPPVIATEISGLRIFAGYSGWSPGQLEDELAKGGWVVVGAEAGDITATEPDHLWRTVLRRQHGRIGWLSTYPADPSEN
ncbi:YqgE/AlgH family protein [Kribbia dieselivorans]|uniref:YqgE/AlgH family protein n=1 Tax=Kribbia dieselivorans TaxID=331526 RepID=UPI00083970FE|nr:YqgE/AlgH family protein [Kribbia dieselivorans]